MLHALSHMRILASNCFAHLTWSTHRSQETRKKPLVGAVRDTEVMGKKSTGGMLRQEDLRREGQGKMGDHRVEERINPKMAV